MDRMFVVLLSRSQFNLGHVGSKTRSVGQIEEKSYFHSRCHIFDPVSMKFGQNVLIPPKTNFWGAYRSHPVGWLVGWLVGWVGGWVAHVKLVTSL